VKFLVDAQLPARLARLLNEHGYDAMHTSELPNANRTPDDEIDNLIRCRDLLRGLFTAVVDGEAPPPVAIQGVNDAAAEAPVTLAARRARDGTIDVERIHPGADAVPVLRGECARAALALLTGDRRDRLTLCRAPSCMLFWLYAVKRGWRRRIDATGRCCHGAPQRRRSRSR
jgi:predicted RNA-binding Zn ribbon-like protein